MGVNAGVSVAAKMLQKAVGVVADGIVGSKTIDAVNSDDPKTVYDSINAQREAKYRSLALHPGQGQFLHSWLSRIKPYIV